MNYISYLIIVFHITALVLYIPALSCVPGKQNAFMPSSIAIDKLNLLICYICGFHFGVGFIILEWEWKLDAVVSYEENGWLCFGLCLQLTQQWTEPGMKIILSIFILLGLLLIINVATWEHPLFGWANHFSRVGLVLWAVLDSFKSLKSELWDPPIADKRLIILWWS